MSEEAEVILIVADDLTDDSSAPLTDDVLAETARRCEISDKEARSALLEALSAGVCYRTEEDRLKTI